MANSANVCIGGGETDVFSSSAQDYVTKFGYLWNPSDPFAVVYPLILNQYRPSGQKAGGPWDALAEGCMRTRAILFCNKTPGDCAVASSSAPSLGTLTGVSVASKLGTTAASVVGGIAGVASVTGPIAAGVGIAVSTILQVFQAHAAAEARQSTALCGISGPTTNAIQSVDAAIAQGQDTPASGAAAMSYIYSQMVAALGSIFKKGNAADGYERVMQCQVALAQYRYGIVPLPVPLGGNSSVSVNQTSTIVPIPGTSEVETPVTVTPVSTGVVASQIQSSGLAAILLIAAGVVIFLIATRR